MAHYPERGPGTQPPPADAAQETQIARQIGAWAAPTPRWRDSPARARIGKYAQVQQQQLESPPLLAQIRRRIDLVGWILGQSSDGMLNMFEDMSDPRVVMYNRIIGTAYRHTGPQGVLLRYTAAGI